MVIERSYRLQFNLKLSLSILLLLYSPLITLLYLRFSASSTRFPVFIEDLREMTEVAQAPAPLEKLQDLDLTKTEHEQSENTTVFHDPNAFTVKHPLINKWTLWYTKPPSAGQRGADAWADNLKEVITFDSVEEFWGCARFSL